MSTSISKEFQIENLGRCTVQSPILLSKKPNDDIFDYITDKDRVLIDNSLEFFLEAQKSNIIPDSFEKAGPREKIYFEPAKTKVGIVTCGGLCPGLNNVIRALVFQLLDRYKVASVVGFRYGYEGFIPDYNHPVVDLSTEMVDDIHTHGGTILGSSRGSQDLTEIVDTLERMNINMLFTIGGDGTLKGAYNIQQEIKKRGLKIAVAGIPKTIDNDINFVERSFGFVTAFSIVNDIVRDAHNEAKGAYNGIALVKVMGRDSGFIAAHAALSIPEVNFVLIPELPFDLYGPKGFLKTLRKRLERKQHAVIIVAEGVGQELFEGHEQITDKSGNKLNHDIGLFLKAKIEEEFDAKKFPYVLKYIDPSYIIRSAPANANDSKFCIQLAQNAVHAAMAGKTGFVVGNWNSSFTLLPIPLAVKERQKVDLESSLWQNVLDATGQPNDMKNK